MIYSFTFPCTHDSHLPSHTNTIYSFTLPCKHDILIYSPMKKTDILIYPSMQTQHTHLHFHANMTYSFNLP